MTWMEVIDTAIKIGLGALLAGVFNYLNNKSTLTRDSRKRYADRRRDLLEKVLNMLIEYEKTYRHQKAAFDWAATMQVNDPDYAKATSQFRDWDEKLRVAHEGFAEASAILLMIGEPEAEAALEQFRTLAYRWSQDSIIPSNANMLNNLVPLREQIITSREKLMSRLAATYRAE